MKFSAKAWKRYNPPLHYQNRLRHKDYIELIRAAGFEILEESLEKPSDSEYEVLKNMNISSAFSNYSLEELSIQQSTIVAIK